MSSVSLVPSVLNHIKNKIFTENPSETVEIKLSNNTKSDDHYLSDIIFAEATKTSNGKTEKHQIAIKYGHVDETVRENVPIGCAFRSEIEIYTKVLPRFHKLQLEKSCPLFSSIPRCYFATLSGPTEVVVMENLKSKGYRVHEKSNPMNIAHIEILLEAYAEWHALSFALKDQYPEEYEQITANLKGAPIKSFFGTMFGKLLNNAVDILYDILESKGEMELVRKYKTLLGDLDASVYLQKITDEPEDVSILLHGDCWNNNFLFKYEEDNQKPTDVTLVDFQLATVRSPVLDISYFLYVSTPPSEFQRFRDLLHFYYKKLSEHIKKLGSDPEKVYPMKTFKSHWKKYSSFGAMLCPSILVFCHVNDLQINFTDESYYKNVLPLIMADQDYYERVLSTLKTYFEFDF